MKNKKLDNVGEFFFDEKTASLHQLTKTGFNSAKYRNLDEEIEKNLEKHFKELEEEEKMCED